MLRDLSKFKNSNTQTITFRNALWWAIQNLGFKSFWVPSKLRVLLLRMFGAEIGANVFIRRGVRIHFPDKLKIGDNCWIGEDVWFINHEDIVIGSNVCVSQSAIICSSGHNLYSIALDYKHGPISIFDGAWICLGAIILAESTIGKNSIISAGEVFTGFLESDQIYVKGTAKPVSKLK